MNTPDWERIKKNSDMKVSFHFLSTYNGELIEYTRDPVFKARFRCKDFHVSSLIACETDRMIHPGDTLTAYVSVTAPSLVLPELSVGDKVGIYLGFGTPDEDNAVGEVLELFKNASDI